MLFEYKYFVDDVPFFVDSVYIDNDGGIVVVGRYADGFVDEVALEKLVIVREFAK